VAIFILASTKELSRSPTQKAVIDARMIRQPAPNTRSYAACPFQPWATGRCTTVHSITAMNSNAPNPAHSARRARA
jgi:hypothetical protein